MESTLTKPGTTTTKKKGRKRISSQSERKEQHQKNLQILPHPFNLTKIQEHYTIVRGKKEP